MEIHISNSKTCRKLLPKIIWKGNSVPTELVALAEEVRNMLIVCECSCGLCLSRSQEKETISKNDWTWKYPNKKDFRLYWKGLLQEA